MRSLTSDEIAFVSGGGESSDAGSGLVAIGTALVTVGGAIAVIPGGQIPGAIIAADGLLLMASGGMIQLADGFGS